MRFASKCSKPNRENTFALSLEKKYDVLQDIRENQVILMGDAQAGKTSLLRTLCGKNFQKYNPSTLVLNDTRILEVVFRTKEIKPTTKYQLCVQRVRNAVAVRAKQQENKTKKEIYDLPFQKELIQRTLAAENFINYFAHDNNNFHSRNLFLRVLDFGGQEIFSSVHPIFMNSNAVYIIIFNLTKLSRDMKNL
eukprot:snap_masked-scaffold_30-processed-gene-2.31-mRNA-1 protein AED:1.00 eAED:1.00 QI:0/0/0/0/1/1/2/0/192